MTDQTQTRLADIERTNERIIVLLEHLTEKVESRIETTDAWRERTDLILMGDGNGRKGHNVRIDRIEQTLERQKWLTRALMSGVALVLVKAVLDLIVK